MILFILDLIVAAVLLLQIMRAKVVKVRGTNALTRTMREVSSNGAYSMVIMIASVVTLIVFVIGLIFKCWYAAFPTLGVIVAAFVIQFKQSKEAQRIKDARVVTKGSLKVAGATAQAVGTVAGGVAEAHGVVGATKMGNQLGKAVGSISDDIGDSMTDVEAPTIRKVEIEDPAAFIAACKRVGIKTEGRDLGEIAATVIDAAPSAYLEAHPEMTDMEKAMSLMR